MLRFKAKDLMMMPELLALSLQADGWYIRSSIIWAKPNPMPESCRDRPTRSHEYVFLLSKAARYYYDQQGIAEPLERPEEADRRTPAKFGGADKFTEAFKQSRLHSGNEYRGTPNGTRNSRSVWTIATHAYSAAHFATFPPELAERCIRAGTSERGCCAQCGAPWVRVTDVSYTDAHRGMVGNQRKIVTAKPHTTTMHAGRENDVRMDKHTTTTGWSPSCGHEADVVPATVLDPFIGAGTTALVSDRLQRDCIGIDLNTQYTTIAMERCRADAPLLADLGPAPEHPVETEIADLFGMAAD